MQKMPVLLAHWEIRVRLMHLETINLTWTQCFSNNIFLQIK